MFAIITAFKDNFITLGGHHRKKAIIIDTAQRTYQLRSVFQQVWVKEDGQKNLPLSPKLTIKMKLLQ